MLPVEVGSSLQAINVNYLRMEFNSAHVYQPFDNLFKGDMSDSVTNYNNVGNTKVSVSIKKLMPTNAH